jgi:hypothetical protein
VNRAVPLLAAVAGAAVLLFLLFYRPDSRPPPAVAVPVAADEPPPPDVGVARQRPRPAAPAVKDAPESPAPSVAAAPAPDAEVDEGPWTFSFGEQTIHLKDESGQNRVARFTLKATTSSKEALQELRLRREKLLRMVYFLGAHRRADGAAGSSGQARFESDVAARWANVVRSGPIEEVEFAEYRVEPREE